MTELKDSRFTISIHALREEGDHTPVTVRPSRLPFLSTPSARRATSCPAGCRLSAWISIHALREEGDRLRQPERHEQAISIHALREEGDMCDELMELTDKKFLSTPSARRATRSRQITQALPADFYPRPPRGGRPGEKVVGVGLFGISIHALREEGDGAYPPWRPARCNFYPRPPRGGRRCIGFAPVSSLVFLSTPSARRATGDVCRLHSCADISIHALREEGDRLQCGTDSA